MKKIKNLMAAIILSFMACAVTVSCDFIEELQPKDKPNAVGDIVFCDGTAASYKVMSQLSNNQENRMIAIIYKVENGKCWGVSLNAGSCSWGGDTDITTIRCVPEGTPGNYTFSGDTDGSDNIEAVKQFMNFATYDDLDERYPGFKRARHYSGGLTFDKDIADCKDEYKSGWYVPSIAELYEIYKIRNIVKKAISCPDAFKTEQFWSSSQVTSNKECAYAISFNDGTIQAKNKTESGRFFYVHEF